MRATTSRPSNLEEPFISGWEEVKKYLDEKSSSGLILGLIEADKLLNKALAQKGYPGKDLEAKISFAKERFSNIKVLLKGRKIRNQLISQIDYNLTSLDLEEAISSYKQAIIDINSDPQKLTLSDKLLLYTDYYFPSKLKALKKFFIFLLLFFAGVWFLAHTKTGQALVKFTVWLSEIIFSWVLAVLLFVLGVVTIIILSLLYFERRRRAK